MTGSSWGELLEVHQAQGAQIAAFTYEGEVVVAEAFGEDLLGSTVQRTSTSNLYCLAKPLLASALATDAEARAVLATPVATIMVELIDGFDGVTGWSLLNHSACIEPVPLNAMAILPRRVALLIASGLTTDPVLAATGSARYHDVAPWLIVDECLLRTTGRGIYERAAQRYGAGSELAFHADRISADAASSDLLTDGVVGPPKRTPFRALNDPVLIGDRMPILSTTGSAGGLARAMADLGASVEAGELGSEFLASAASGAMDHELNQRLGAGTMLGLNAWGIGEVGDGLVGHLGWAGTGTTWFDPARRMGCAMRLFGLDLTGDDAFRFRIRAMIGRFSNEIAGADARS